MYVFRCVPAFSDFGNVHNLFIICSYHVHKWGLLLSRNQKTGVDVMRNTKENILKLLEAMEETSLNVSRDVENKVLADKLAREAITYRSCIWLLTDKKYFNELCEIYEIE